MSKLNLLQYSGNIYKKSLEIYINKLKSNVSKYLENNELEKVKEIIKNIDGIRKLEKEIDDTLLKYLNNFPEEKLSPESKSYTDESEKNYIHYTSEIIDIIDSSEEIEIFSLKSSLYDEIISHISSEEISNSKKIPNLLNWEVYFYKSLILLLSKEFIQFKDGDLLILTDNGKNFQAKEFDIASELSDDDQYLGDETFDKLVRKNEELDLIASVRSYLMSNLVSDGILPKNEERYFYDTMFYIINSIISMDGLEVHISEQIKVNNFYKVKRHFDNEECIVFVKKKIVGLPVFECIDEDNNTALYAFL